MKRGMLKSDAIRASLKVTREKHKNQACWVYEIKRREKIAGRIKKRREVGLILEAAVNHRASLFLVFLVRDPEFLECLEA